MPDAVDVMGVSFATNTVTVNGQTAYRKGEYFRKEIPVSNGSVPVWQSITNAATGQASITGNVFVPKTPELFYYDADGNLTNDGRWRYAWDAENRLVSLTTNTAVGPRQSIKFEYDWQGRRIRKQVWPNASWNGTPTNDVKFVYDGWNLVAESELYEQRFVIRSFMWGSDLSGTSQGAGGVGGLLFIRDVPSAIGYCAPAYDGNGNVAALVSMSGGTNCATYEYGPFGEVIRATGPMAKANPFRFSTKYQDDETDLLYYGYRYYNASTGRWLSRDPMDEEGSLDLYGFADNEPINTVDILGLQGKKLPPKSPTQPRTKPTQPPTKSPSPPKCPTCKDFDPLNNKDPKIQELNKFLKQNNCPYKFYCYEGDDCRKNGLGDGIGGKADNEPWDGSIRIRFCASNFDPSKTDYAVVEGIRHELAHAALLCLKRSADSCEKRLCHEIYSYGTDGYCARKYPNDQEKYFKCLRDRAIASSEGETACAHWSEADMQKVLTQTFVKSCLGGSWFPK